jgi:hypothetical protein
MANKVKRVEVEGGVYSSRYTYIIWFDEKYVDKVKAVEGVSKIYASLLSERYFIDINHLYNPLEVMLEIQSVVTDSNIVLDPKDAEE